MGHADGLGTLRLAGIDGDDAAPDGLRHIRAGVDGHDQDGSGPDVVKPQGVVGEVGQAVVDEEQLHQQRRVPAELDICPHKAGVPRNTST